MTEDKATLLIVDDVPLILTMMETLFDNQGYRLHFAENGRQALQKSRTVRPDLILLDLMLPDMTGIEVCEKVRADWELAEIPIIMITAISERGMRLTALEAGADEYITKPFDSVELLARVRTVLRLNRYRHLLAERARFQRLTELSPDGIIILNSHLRVVFANQATRPLLGLDRDESLVGRHLNDFVAGYEQLTAMRFLQGVLADEADGQRLETIFLRKNGYPLPVELSAARVQWGPDVAIQVIVHDIREHKRSELQIQQANHELIQAYDATLEAWVHALDLRNRETAGHTARVTALTMKLATRLGVDDEMLEHIRRGALLHDIGKIGIPDGVLHKTGALASADTAVMKAHPEFARVLLEPIEYLRPAMDIPYCHHEKWDGTGYPRGLVGEAIPLAARVFTVVDVWDALMQGRAWRPPLSFFEAFNVMRDELGKTFDPAIGAVFLEEIGGWWPEIAQLGKSDDSSRNSMNI